MTDPATAAPPPSPPSPPAPLPSLPSLPARIAAALPDGVVAATFLVVWIAPFALGERAVRNALLTMLVEFIVVHASGFLGSVAFDRDKARAKRVAALAGFAVFYSLFIAAFAFAFGEWWPFVVFAWLLVGKFAGVLAQRQASDVQVKRMQMEWGTSVLFYLVGVFATTMLWIPRLGMTATVQPQFGLDGGGVWVDEPHRVVAFGVLYFGALAWVKLRGRPLLGGG